LSAKLGPYAMSPPASTNSLLPDTTANRCCRARSMRRRRWVKVSGSGKTTIAVLSLTMPASAESKSSAVRTPTTCTRAPIARAALSTSLKRSRGPTPADPRGHEILRRDMPEHHPRDIDLRMGDLKGLLTGLPLAVIALDLDETVTFWNPAAERLFGWRSDEVLGRPVPTVPDDLETEAAIIRKAALAGNTLGAIGTRRRRQDGTLVDVALSLAPLRDGTGAVIGTIGVLADVTDRAEDAGARQQADIAIARLAAIVDSSDDAIVSKTLGGVITSWNRAAERIFGWTAAEAVGQHITLIIPKERHAEEDHVLGRIVRGE